MTRSTLSRPISGATWTASPTTSITSAKAPSTQASLSTICWPACTSSRTSLPPVPPTRPPRGFIGISPTARPTSSPINPTNQRTLRFVCEPQDPTYRSGGRWMAHPLQRQRSRCTRRKLCRQSPAWPAAGNLHPGAWLHHRPTRSCCSRIRLRCASQPRTTAAASTSPTRHTVMTIPGPWTVTFPPHLGAPTNIRLEKLRLLDSELRSRRQVLLRNRNLFHDLRVPASALRVRHLTLHL